MSDNSEIIISIGPRGQKGPQGNQGKQGPQGIPGILLLPGSSGGVSGSSGGVSGSSGIGGVFIGDISEYTNTTPSNHIIFWTCEFDVRKFLIIKVIDDKKDYIKRFYITDVPDYINGTQNIELSAIVNPGTTIFNYGIYPNIISEEQLEMKQVVVFPIIN